MRSLPDWPASRRLRSWQERALAAVHSHAGDSFLASATPAAGKTTFGLRVAHDMLRSGRVRRIVVVAPTAHICRQWAADAARYGIDLEPGRPNAAGLEPDDRHGVSVTYAGVASAPSLHARGCTRATLLIADEPHHMGDDAAWGARARTAFGGARFRLLLSGTPFRSDNTPIPWVSYDEDGISRADHTYTYTEALLERVCRPVAFHTYDGDMEWTAGGRRRRADFSLALPAQEAARRLRTALDAEGDWLGHVLRDADARLHAVRESQRDAGGLVVAMDKDHARSIAARMARITGEAPPVVTSDDPRASAAIASFASGTQRWLVSVLMVSEGVDIPRLRVGVYATTARTELFFRQVVGRFIRRSPGPRGQLSHLFMPSDPTLKRLAAQIEEEREHALRLELPDETEAVERAEPTPGEVFQALSSSARPDEAILSTVAPGDNLSLFGDPAPSPHLAAFAATPAAAPSSAGTGAFSRREQLRTERSALVAALARRTGSSHREINGQINREVGAASVAAATLEQLERGNELLARYAAKR
jgi:superfamily II DNA or RNA helicase